MKLKTVGKLLIALGIAVVLYALTMPVSIGYSDVVNIHLMNERQNTLFIGGLMFISGIVLFATFKVKQTKEEAALEESASQAKIKIQKAKIDEGRQLLEGHARTMQSKLANGWHDHGVARLISGIFVGLCVWATMPYSVSRLFDFFALIPLALAFRNCLARTAVIQLHLINIAFITSVWVIVDRNPVDLILIFFVSVLFIFHAKWRLKPVS